MLCQANDLPHVVRIMRDLPVDGLHDGVWLGANGNLSTQIFVAQRRERVENMFPSAFPRFHQCGACFRCILEFRVAIAVRLLSVSRQKIRPARTHVSRQVFHNDGDRVRCRIERVKEPLVRALLDRALSELFVVSKNVGGILRIGCRELVCHEAIFFSRSELSTPPSKLAVARPSWVTDSGLAQLSAGAILGGSGSPGCQKEALDNSLFFRLVSLLANSDFAREAVMTIGQSMLPEFDQEMQSTRKTLERVPDDKWNWKPHEKSGTVGWLASHVATMVGWLPMTINTEELDYAPVGGPAFELPKIANRKELLAEFDKNVAESRAALSKVGDAEMMKDWKLLAGGQEIFKMPRVACIRGMVLNHLIHHRAQLTVYFRLIGVPVPGLYGPSADEAQPGAAEAAAN